MVARKLRIESGVDGKSIDDIGLHGTREMRQLEKYSLFD